VARTRALALLPRPRVAARNRGDARLYRTAPLFANSRTGTPCSEKAVANLWRAACKRAGVDYVSACRALKHSPGTALLERGLSVGDLQAAFRHRSGRTTMNHDLEQGQYR
jgi:site-specific recombinase XerD